jgi:hypothetical protein
VKADFAENYTIQLQNVQSAHWSKSQITVFTAFIWNAENKAYSCAVISDEFDHNKYSVHTFLNKLMQDIISVNPEVENVTFISDGATDQFKCFLSANLKFFQGTLYRNCFMTLPCHITW